MQCEICLENFNEGTRRPKIYNCGHTVCLSCSKGCWRNGSITCPMDRQAFRVPSADSLKDNYYLLSVLDGPRTSSNNQSLRSARPGQIRAEIEKLERNFVLQEEALECLKKVSASVQRVADQFAAAQQETVQAISDSSNCLQLSEDRWQPVLQAVRRAARNAVEREAKLKRDLELMKTTGTCTVSVQTQQAGAGAGAGAAPQTYSATFNLGTGNAKETESTVRHLLYLLGCEGSLKSMSAKPEQSMNDGVRKSTENVGVLTFRYLVPNIRSLDKETLLKSPKYHAHNIAWWVEVGKNAWEEEHPYLEVYVYAKPKGGSAHSTTWKCRAEVEIALLATEYSRKPDFAESFTHTFSKKKSNTGFSKLIIWSKLFDPHQGLIDADDGSVELGITIKADVPTGI